MEPRRTSTGRAENPWPPEWLEGLPVAVWLVDPAGVLRFLNAPAERLLGLSAASAVGRPCHAVVATRDSAGLPLCGEACPVRAAARRGEAAAPIEVRRPEAGRGAEWLQILFVRLTGPDGGPWIAHLALDATHTRRMHAYLEGALPDGVLPGAAPGDALTAREREVLELLAAHFDPKTIARVLSLSYATVRNHVQHVLQKMGAHSIEEAVALELLHGRDAAGDLE